MHQIQMRRLPHRPRRRSPPPAASAHRALPPLPLLLLLLPKKPLLPYSPLALGLAQRASALLTLFRAPLTLCVRALPRPTHHRHRPHLALPPAQLLLRSWPPLPLQWTRTMVAGDPLVMTTTLSRLLLLPPVLHLLLVRKAAKRARAGSPLRRRLVRLQLVERVQIPAQALELVLRLIVLHRPRFLEAC